MLPKLENKTQTGTIVYIVLLIINCSIYVYNIIIYTVYNRIKYMPAEYRAPTELVQCGRLTWYTIEMYRMPKFRDPRIQMHMRISVREDPRMRMRMRIFGIL